MLAGVEPAEGVTESHPSVELGTRVKFNCVVESELVSTNGLPVVGPNCTGRPPCWSVTACNPAGIETFSNALLLIKTVTPTSVVVVPLVVVFEVKVTFPVQVPALSPAVTMLTVSTAGVVLDDKLACNHPVWQFPVAAVLILKEMGRGIPPLVICDCCEGGPTWWSS